VAELAERSAGAEGIRRRLLGVDAEELEFSKLTAFL